MPNTLNQLSTEETQELFIVLFSASRGNITRTCEQTGISRATYYNWCKADESFTARLLHMAEERLDFAEDKLLTAIDMMDVSAIRYLLDAQGRSRGYGQASKLEISGPGGEPIAGTVDVKHYPPEPQTMLEWEEQVAASRAIREAESLRLREAEGQAEKKSEQSTDKADQGSSESVN
ncbi:hypothetical protein LCGC14_2733860 [marine sediment metagenome]|uniref:Homeodomain phBC6A51-type domain-containing protein n=1 Tax=marine sediment metagenome TaxID=412755 RepID=A0A0F9BY85_9ZZZZ